MPGHIRDLWYRPKRDENNKIMKDEEGNKIREKSPLYGKGLRYKVVYYDPDGKEQHESFPDRKLKRAQEFLTKQQHDVLSGTYLDPDAGKVKFRAHAETVLMGRSQDESTVRTNRSRLENQVYPFFGDKLLVNFSSDVIRKWLAWMNGRDQPPSESYQGEIFDLVTSVLDAAVADGRMRKNPCRDKSISRPSGNKNKVAPWPESKMRKIELALPARYKVTTSLGAGLGLRQGEIFAFSLDNVDREKMIYHCTRQVVYVDGALKFKLPKGHKTRDIPIGEGVLEGLDAYAENYPPIPITLPWAERDGRKSETVNVLMTNANQRPFIAQNFNDRIWKPAFKQAGLVHQTDSTDGLHALRHLFASWMLQQGVSIKELAAFLGHSSEGFTLRTYVHLMPNSYDRARLAVNTMFKPRKQASTKDNSAG